MNAAEFTILLAEFKAMIHVLLYTAPETVTTRSLDDLITFNAETPAELEFFDQSILEQAAKAPGIMDKTYPEALATAKRLAGKEGIDKLLADNNVIAIVAPSGGPAWTTDLVTGGHFLGAAYSMAAIGVYPSIIVPMGNTRNLPVGPCFFGPKWAEATLIGLAYAYEQRTKARTTPKFLPRSPE